MPDFTKMTVRSLRELARKLLGPGHSRLKTKADIVRALEEAAAVSLKTVIDFLKAPGGNELVRFVLFGSEAYAAYEKALKSLIKE